MRRAGDGHGGAPLAGPIFAELSDAAVARLAERCVQRTAGAGVVLFTAGEECRGLYVVASGRVRISGC